MQHHFDVELAKQYGMVEAVLLNHFEYWIELNRANGKNYFEGRYWTFNSMKAFSEIFPYLSEKKIRNALKNLQDAGLILTGNFNKSAYDRTLWYAFSDLSESILPKRQMEVAEKANQNSQKGEPIPDNNTDTNSNDYPDNNNPHNPPEGERAATHRRAKTTDYDADGFAAFWAAYPKKAGKADALKAWNKLKPDIVLQAKMGEALTAQKKSPQWTKNNGQYIPMPSTWLNGRRWEDEAPQAQSQESQFDRMMAWAKEFDEKHGSV